MHMATALLQQVPGVTTDNLRIVDDSLELLHAWKTRTRDVRMTHLQSSASNHLDVREDALRKCAEEKRAGRTAAGQVKIGLRFGLHAALGGSI